MASKINTLQDLQIEKMRVKVLLKQQEDKIEQHYQYISSKIRPFTGIIDAFGSFSGDGEKGSSRSAWMGLVGTVLKMGLPIIIQRFFHKPDAQPTTWWGGLLNGLGSVIDSDLVKSVMDRILKKKDVDENEMEEMMDEGAEELAG